MFKWLERRTTGRRNAQDRRRLTRQLYDVIVAQARHPDFYRRCLVPDTVRGRFEVLAMHMYLVMDRLRTAGEPAHQQRSQQLVDTMFDDMDDVAREIGVGDMGVAPKIKKLARSFRSRLEAYEKAMEDDDRERLALVVGGILFNNGEAQSAAGEAEQAAAGQLAAYMRRQRQRLAARSADELLAGAVPDLFGESCEREGQ